MTGTKTPAIYYARRGRRADGGDGQTVRDHSMSVASLARGLAEPMGLGNAASLAGYGHDLGKVTAAFAARLAGEKIRVDHSTAGAAEVSKLGSGNDRLVCDLVAYCIAGHHAGLPDKTSVSNPTSSLSARIAAHVDKLDPSWRQIVELNPVDLMPPKTFRKEPTTAFRLAVMGRMIFSCLVAADTRDTIRFHEHLAERTVTTGRKSLADLLPEFIAAFEERKSRFPSAESDINLCRRDILEHVREKASLGPGMFRMTVPTGGGKTLTGFAFCLDHALLHGKRRIINVIPFTTVIEQTAGVLAGIVGRENVLEHHSNFDPVEEADEGARTPVEDWDSPIVVTTTVQFFESLFSSRRSACHKLHNIANSVIVIDEVQAIPTKYLVPCMTMLSELARNYGCSVVLCSATQPALDSGESDVGRLVGIDLIGRELAPDPDATARRLNKVTVRLGGEMSNAAIARELFAADQGLVIVNTRLHALDLYRDCEADALDGLYHLSTRQTAEHRKEILADVRQRLADGLPCRVISTSLIEAGVDIGFAKVWRMEAGLDRIAQAAGRCNRERALPKDKCVVTVFSSRDYPADADTARAAAEMYRICSRYADPFSPDAMRVYFKAVYWSAGMSALDGEDIIGMFKLSRSGETDFAYRTADRAFNLVESRMIDVIVPHSDEARMAICSLEDANANGRSSMRKLQRYCVPVPPEAFHNLMSKGSLGWVGESIHGRRFAKLVDTGLYDKASGMRWEGA